MSWIRTFGESTMMCDGCKTSQISVSRDEVPEADWNEKAEADLRERAASLGWWWPAPIFHYCPECG